MLTGTLAMGLAATAAVDPSLLAQLAERFPAVSRWEIKPIGAAVPPAADLKVLQLGARSAVQVGRRVYWYSVAGFARALTATRGVAPGQLLNPGDVRLTESNILAASCDPLTDPAVLSGKRARRTLHANDVICAAAVEPRPLVARGEEVVVRYVGLNISLTTNAVAQKDGVAGDSLLVMNPRSHDLFRAVVSGVREVTVHD